MRPALDLCALVMNYVSQPQTFFLVFRRRVPSGVCRRNWLISMFLLLVLMILFFFFKKIFFQV